MARIQLNDTAMSAAMKMSDGNPGAIRVCAEMLKCGAEIDPDSAMGGLANLLDLDTLKIYGSRIWMLFKDVCGEDLRVTCAILRAWQLGYVSDDELNRAIENRGEGIDVDDLVAQIEKRLPSFQQASGGDRIMFTTKKVIITGKSSEKLSKSVDSLMAKGSELLGKGMEMLDAGMDVLDEAFDGKEATESVSTTIRIRLTPEQAADLLSGRSLTFKAAGQTIVLERQP